MLGVFAGALVVTAVGPSAAMAGRLASGSSAALGGNHRITFTDRNPNPPGVPYAGEANTLSITFDGTNYVVRDETSPITIPTATNACQLTGFTPPGTVPSVAICRGTIGTSTVQALTVNSGNGVDKVTNDTSLPSELNGGNGDDTINGGSGNDVIKPGGGRDSVDARAGDDNINTSGYNATTGNKGDPDQLITCGPGNDTVTMDQLDGITDKPSCENVIIEPVVAPPPGQPQQPPVIPATPAVSQSPPGTNLPNRPAGTPRPPRGACSALFIGTAAADRFVGNNGGDRMFGRAGNDVMNGFGGDDCLYGESGRDRINGHSGKDIAVGGSGNDVVNGGSGNDKLYGKSGNDRLLGGSGSDRIWGDAGKDTIVVGSGSNVVFAGSGNDTIRARNGRRDVIRCGSGRDRVRADRRDRLVGCERRS